MLRVCRIDKILLNYAQPFSLIIVSTTATAAVVPVR